MQLFPSFSPCPKKFQTHVKAAPQYHFGTFPNYLHFPQTCAKKTCCYSSAFHLFPLLKNSSSSRFIVFSSGTSWHFWTDEWCSSYQTVIVFRKLFSSFQFPLEYRPDRTLFLKDFDLEGTTLLQVKSCTRSTLSHTALIRPLLLEAGTKVTTIAYYATFIHYEWKGKSDVVQTPVVSSVHHSLFLYLEKPVPFIFDWHNLFNIFQCTIMGFEGVTMYSPLLLTSYWRMRTIPLLHSIHA